jgi:hypothetical protein
MKEDFLLLILTYLTVTQKKLRKGRQKRSGSKKTNGIYHYNKNDRSKGERERR